MELIAIPQQRGIWSKLGRAATGSPDRRTKIDEESTKVADSWPGRVLGPRWAAAQKARADWQGFQHAVPNLPCQDGPASANGVLWWRCGRRYCGADRMAGNPVSLVPAGHKLQL